MKLLLLGAVLAFALVPGTHCKVLQRRSSSDDSLLRTLLDVLKRRETVYECTDGKTIPIKKRCDHFPDCHDHDDEKFCISAKCMAAHPGVPEDKLNYCDSGDLCFGPAEVCDGTKQCKDGGDEPAFCPMCNGDAVTKSPDWCKDYISPENLKTRGLVESQRLDLIGEECHDDKGNYDGIWCKDKSKCIETKLICDHRTHCKDWSDEKGCMPAKCDDPKIYPDRKLYCDGGNQCYKPKEDCDNTKQCEDGYDETGCEEFDPFEKRTSGGISAECIAAHPGVPKENLKLCDSGAKCFSPAESCDNYFLCIDGSDEPDWCGQCNGDTVTNSPSWCADVLPQERLKGVVQEYKKRDNSLKRLIDLLTPPRKG